ncbi:hypothetical protein ASPSYDRAFT_612545 [Aspergillus sydowii CBS 593.65]|uniref:Uncharacterized protein n=1 Tax=Aspergillus sydowii CBS 593.65 TaxID=1036612 RepID=A0A1L9TRR3_9EURO|nr:uncharacterized protein ASPSYDRAFT_612545 [Aspergillus sydowii CBS 593.65]OJJ62101.1 hypothetical protein ASPSYDRAFT_612545 [Aspergillus sydowii CBS 593.65]
MFKMHQPPELEETDNVSFYEADVSSDASSDASTDASSSESLPFEENSSTGRSSQEPARVPQGPRLPRSQSTPPDIRDLLPECNVYSSTSDLETTRPKSVSPESQTSCTSASSLPATEATMIKALHPDKYGLEEQWKEIVTTTRWNGGMALRALNRNPVTQCAASEPAPESDRKRKRESSSSDPDATEYSEGPGEGPSTGQGGSLARSKTSKGKQKQHRRSKARRTRKTRKKTDRRTEKLVRMRQKHGTIGTNGMSEAVIARQ